MNTTKKLLVFVMVALMAAMSLMPSTFSWYSHNGTAEGKLIKYSKEDLPVSMISSSSADVTMSTVESDANNIKSDTVVNKVDSLPADSLKYYTTTIQNTGINPVYVDLNMKNLGNNADFYIGTLSPTINEKSYASRAVKNKVSYNETRVYFKPYPGDSNNNWDFWHKDDGSLTPESSAAAGSNNSTNDINIAYKLPGSANENMEMMKKCPDTDSNKLGNSYSKVYYFDLPSNAEYFYFFNHWYLKSNSSREWNRTVDIKDTKTKGVLYYLNGNTFGEELYKDYGKLASDPSLVAVNSYYDSVRMSKGSNVIADIGLKQENSSENDDEEFVADYFGNSISYALVSGDDSGDDDIINISTKDGIITPKQNNTYGTKKVRTTITGRFGDTESVDTTVTIPTNISQVPIMQNILVGENDKVDIHWYALNKSTSVAMNTQNIFITI